MPTARTKLRKQLKAYRKRKLKPRKAVQDLDDEVAPIAIGSPAKGE